jgi:hypothetical protein
MPRVRLTVTLLALAAGLALPAAAGALTVGVAEQTPDVFHDPRFLVLGIHAARLSVAWDVFENRAQTRAVETWLKAAKADGVSPLISFDHHLPSSKGHSAPTVGQLLHTFRVFRARYPWVRDFATWNEANYCGEPTCHQPALVAAYYRALRRTCRACTILGAELLDQPGMATWVRQFQDALGGSPAVWGLHNYIGANRLETGSTVALLRATRAEVWLTETGGVVARHNHSNTGFPQNPQHAALVTGFIFNRLALLSPRITRVYLYQWNAGPGRNRSWDSGLLGPEPSFTARPAFATLVKLIAAMPHSPLQPVTESALLSRRGSLIAGALLAPHATAPLAGTVTLHNAAGRVLGSETVAAGQRYAFAVTPGRYGVSAVRTVTRVPSPAISPSLGTTPSSDASAPVSVPCGALGAAPRRGPGLNADLVCPAPG